MTKQLLQTEYEATFTKIDKSFVRKQLKASNATLLKEEFLQKRSTFQLPKGHEIKNGWLRVRDEKDKITMSLKVANNGGDITDQKEIELKIDSLEKACEFLKLIGCEQKAYQENLRETWELDSVIITIDEWPYLEAYVEIEGESEELVKKVAEKLGFDYKKAYFGSVDGLYSEKYKISEDRINNHTPLIVFDMDKNPFLN